MKNETLAFRDELIRPILNQIFGTEEDSLYEFVLPLLEWQELHGNKYLFHEGDKGTSLYILLSGRLKVVVRQANGINKKVGEISRGETVGEMSLLTGEPRSAGIMAIRDSTLVRLSEEAFQQVVSRYPTATLNISKLIIARLKAHNHNKKAIIKSTNIAFVPIGPGVELKAFVDNLEIKMKAHKKILNLCADSVNKLLQNSQVSSASSDMGIYHLFSDWLDEKEHEHDHILFQADNTSTEWTKRCLRQADEIILVGHSDDLPKLGEIEQTLLFGDNKITSAVQSLVLLHQDNNIKGTKRWTSRRELKSTYHVRNSKEGDIEKLARFLTGNASGLVLSGGGARGLSHIGVMKALEENNIPYDFVGGTSIGAIMGSLVALDYSAKELYEVAKDIFTNNPTPKRDYNFLPLISLVSGRRMNKILKNTIGDVFIEDLPINFFCISANLTKAKTAVHQSGSLRKAVRASISLPGIFPPAILGNELHVDGGVFNNLPIDVMENMGLRNIIAVDLDMGEDDNIEIQRMPSSWNFLIGKIWKHRHHNVPNIMSTIIKSSTINSMRRTRNIRGRADLYINPDVSNYGLLEWKKFEELVEIGYRDTIKVLDRWRGFRNG